MDKRKFSLIGRAMKNVEIRVVGGGGMSLSIVFRIYVKRVFFSSNFQRQIIRK